MYLKAQVPMMAAWAGFEVPMRDSALLVGGGFFLGALYNVTSVS